MSARRHSWSLALAVVIVIATASCETDELFTPLGTFSYTVSGGLVSQGAETQGNQIMTWRFEIASIDVDGQGSFAYLEPAPCEYIQNVSFFLGFSAFCGVQGYTFSEGTYPSTVNADVSEITIRRACRPPLPDDEDHDGDNVNNSDDNCQLISNEDQADINGDGFGDACSLPDANGELTIPDRDGDLIADFADNCLWMKNTNQMDSEANAFLQGIGDVCEREADVILRPPGVFQLPVDIPSRGSAVTFAVIDFDSNPASALPAVVCTPNFVDCAHESELRDCVLIDERVTARAN